MGKKKAKFTAAKTVVFVSHLNCQARIPLYSHIHKYVPHLMCDNMTGVAMTMVKFLQFVRHQLEFR
jgi:hypothetical protein